MTATVHQCAILAGGLATRLGALTAETPKAILRCGDRPFLAWLMRELMRFGVTDFVLLTGHLGDAIEAFAETMREKLTAITITVSREPAQAGTGGALYHASEKLDHRFLLCNGDSLFDCNVARVLADASKDGALLSDDRRGVVGRLVLREIADASRYGRVVLEPPYVTAFRARAEAGIAGLINSGIYLFRRDILDYVTPTCSLESDVLPAMARDGVLTGTVATGYFRDIGVPQDYALAQTEIPRLLHRHSLFLVDPTPADLDTIVRATCCGWHVFGIYEHGASVAEMVRAAGGTLDGEWHGPLSAAMLEHIITAWELDPRSSVMFGNGKKALDFAEARGFRVHTNRQPHYRFKARFG